MSELLNSLGVVPWGINVVKNPHVPPGKMVLMNGGQTIVVSHLPCFDCMGRGWLRPEGWPWVTSEICGTCHGIGYEP